MYWTLEGYLKNVFFALNIKFVWVPDILFTNLSKLTGLDTILRIISLWESGVIHFAPVTPAEREIALLNRTSAAPGPLPLTPSEWYGRSDIKARHYRRKTNPLNLPYRRERNGVKSAKIVTDEMEAMAEAEVQEAKKRLAEMEDIEQFTDDDEIQVQLSSDPIEDWD